MIQNRGYLVELKYSPTRKGKSADFVADGGYAPDPGCQKDAAVIDL